ncbi:MAG: hypothetical protein ABSD41_08390 [Candidatus Bathyarchaeia archaeon]
MMETSANWAWAESDHYQVTARCGINYGGLADLVVNAMVDLKKPFIQFTASAQASP